MTTKAKSILYAMIILACVGLLLALDRFNRPAEEHEPELKLKRPGIFTRQTPMRPRRT
jgi:hypothetical protein